MAFASDRTFGRERAPPGIPADADGGGGDLAGEYGLSTAAVLVTGATPPPYRAVLETPGR